MAATREGMAAAGRTGPESGSELAGATTASQEGTHVAFVLPDECGCGSRKAMRQTVAR